MFQAINNAFEKRGNGEPVMVVEINKNAEDNNGDDDKLFKHISQQKKRAWYGQ